jgi:predicted site-specific integrase-resolvase
MTTTNAQPRALLTRVELADALRVSLSTIDRLRRRGVLRPVQLVPGGAVRYAADDVERLLDAPSEPYPADPRELDWH